MTLFKRILGIGLTISALVQLLSAIGSYQGGKKPSRSMALGLVATEALGAYGIWLMVQSFKKAGNKNSSDQA
ncbi:MAG TPA: hypothetical protein VEC36_11795 [Patescibacteria group bacterium]|nr:hypothetical protein [Patescibacteria group bacterium]